MTELIIRPVVRQEIQVTEPSRSYKITAEIELPDSDMLKEIIAKGMSTERLVLGISGFSSGGKPLSDKDGLAGMKNVFVAKAITRAVNAILEDRRGVEEKNSEPLPEPATPSGATDTLAA